MAQQILKVLIVDDSSVYRHLMASVIEQIPDVTIAGTAPTGPIALQKIPSLRPDVVLLDIEMPEMSGVEVLAAIKANHPGTAVVLVSGVNSRSADIVLDALSNGADEFIAKPGSQSLAENRRTLMAELVEVFSALRARHPGRFAASAPPQLARPARAARPIGAPRRGGFSIVAIGISTGGPQALGELIPSLSGKMRVPIVIVQHMPPVFTTSLARSLDKKSKVRVHEAEGGQLLEPGHVYIAPGGVHLVVTGEGGPLTPRYHSTLVDGPPVNSCKPSVDVLFESLAEGSGKGTLAIVMTGMGQDGMAGVQHIKRAGGYCLTQSRESCIVYGMPQAVDNAGLSDESLPLRDLAVRVESLVE